MDKANKKTAKVSKFKFEIHHLVYLLIVGIISTIFFQQVFVVNIGGSLKIYEVIALLMLSIYLLYDKKKYIYGNSSLLLFFLFVLIPTLSLIFYYIRPLPWDYYKRFPEAKHILRANIVIMPILVLIYYWFTWIVINYIISSKEINKKINKILLLFIKIGTLVAIYNFYALIFVKQFGLPDIIPEFMDFRNFTTGKNGRFGGFSDEPGTYVYIQTWVVYYLFLSDLKIKHKQIITIINFLSWLLTISSLLIPGLIILIFGYLHKHKKHRKLFYSIITFTCVILFYNFSINPYFNQIRYFAFEKIKNYVIGGNHTLDSGAYRSFTTKLGIKLFTDNMLLGSGPDTANYYIWKYENQMGIVTWGEKIAPLTSPQNSYSKVLGELGIFGFLSLIIFLAHTISLQRKYIRKSPIMLSSLCGTVFCVFSLMTIYPITNLFLWLNIALSLNLIRFIQKK